MSAMHNRMSYSDAAAFACIRNNMFMDIILRSVVSIPLVCLLSLRLCQFA